MVGTTEGSANTRRVDLCAELQTATERNAQEAREEQEAVEKARADAQAEEAVHVEAQAAKRVEAEAALPLTAQQRRTGTPPWPAGSAASTRAGLLLHLVLVLLPLLVASHNQPSSSPNLRLI